MEIWDYIVEKDFSSLGLFEFDDIREVINLNDYYLRDEDAPLFFNELKKIKEEYERELKKINDYEQNEFVQSLNSGTVPKDDPSYMIGKLESSIIRKFIELIEKYFDLETFNKYKNQLPHSKIEITMLDEDKNELSKALVSIRKYTYHFLNTIGIYYSKKHYFIRKRDVYRVCWKYTNEVVLVNKLDDKDYYFNIFAPWGRLDCVRRGLIDVDNISVQALVLPFLNKNTKVLVNICEIIRKTLPKKGWKATQFEINKYISECEKLGLLEKVE